MRNSLPHRITTGTAIVIGLAFGTGASTDAQEAPRTASGRPDLSGTYDTATLTPLERPVAFGDRLALTEEEAAAIAEGEPVALAAVFGIPPDRNVESAPPSETPPVGGDGSTGAAGAVGGYNTFWMDRGTSAFQIDGQWRTSIITDPPNGRRPPLTAEAQEARAALAGFLRPNSGTAWWMIENGPDAPGPYDDPEIRPLAERCLLGFVELDDAYATGSSMMPQKKNPDVAELARAKAGRLIGSLAGLLATLKGLPLAYAKDLQEDKEPLFDAVDTVMLTLAALDGLLATARFRTDRMADAASSPYAAATDLAEWMVGRGTPFREAHAVVGELVRRSLSGEGALADLAAGDHRLGPEAAGLLMQAPSAARRTTRGAGGPEAVAVQMESFRERIEVDAARLEAERIDPSRGQSPRGRQRGHGPSGP